MTCSAPQAHARCLVLKRRRKHEDRVFPQRLPQRARAACRAGRLGSGAAPAPLPLAQRAGACASHIVSPPMARQRPHSCSAGRGQNAVAGVTGRGSLRKRCFCACPEEGDIQLLKPIILLLPATCTHPIPLCMWARMPHSCTQASSAPPREQCHMTACEHVSYTNEPWRGQGLGERCMACHGQAGICFALC